MMERLGYGSGPIDTGPGATPSPIGFSTTVLLTTLVLELNLAKVHELAPRHLGESSAKRWGGEVYTVTKQARGVVYLT